MKLDRLKEELITRSRSANAWGELLVILAYLSLTLFSPNSASWIAIHTPFDGVAIFAPLYVGGFLLLLKDMKFTTPAFLVLPLVRLSIFALSGMIGEVGADNLLVQMSMTLLGMTVFLFFFNYKNGRDLFRRMLTVFDTADSNEELYFFVYDNITTNSASTQKKFLLHVPTNPDVSGNRVTVTNNQGGRLVLQNVFGGATISKVGGVVYTNGNYNPTASSNYKVNGSQIANANTHDDGYWGRVEIKSNTSSKNTEMLNVMYVCDETDSTNLTAQSISSSKVKGAVLGNTAAVFVSSSTPLSSSHSFSVPGSGTKKYYISGVANGSWTVKRNGTTVGTYQAEGGLLVFTAQTGTIELVK